MKTWVVLFLLLLAAGVACGLARDLFSRSRGTLSGTVVAVDAGNAIPKWLPPSSPRYKVRLDDGSVVNVSAKSPANVPIGAQIAVTEWVTPWGQVWYTQRD